MTDKKEAVIREKRTIEATKKNLMGPSGKFGVILQAFGHPIMRQGSGLCDTNYLDDPFDDFVHTEYSSTVSEQQGPVAYRDEILNSSDDFIYAEGMLFDGLSSGMHIEIIHDRLAHTLKVSYKGYQVYKEVAGELEAYAPFPEWEDMIERLYRSAKDHIKKNKSYLETQIDEKIQEKKKSWWQKLRMRWGV
jgi:hypothetical protein